MEKNYSGLSSYFKPGLFLVAFLLFGSQNIYSQTLTVNNTYTIAAGETEEYSQVNYGSNGSELIVNGTLIVNGDFFLDKNQSFLTMGENARVIIFGSFYAENQVYLTISGYLFVHGIFTKSGASNQDIVIINEGKIYILGGASNWGNEFSTCEGDYDGTTNNIDDNCDYGNEDDYENNQDNFPPDVIDLINCYDLSDISDQEVCEHNTATFSVFSIPDVKYEWQEKNGNADWIKVGTDSNIYTTPNTSIADNGKLYRVIVRPTFNNPSCKISISRKVSLSVQQSGIWNGEVDSNWNNSANWSCNTVPSLETNVLIPGNLASNHFPVINAGTNALAKNLSIQNGASVVNENWLQIAGDLTNSGVLNTATGSISFEGSNVQTIPDGAFQNNRIRNLRIDNTGGVTSEAIIEVTGILKVDRGNFHTGNGLTLISNATQTALIDGSGNGQVLDTVKMQRYLDVAFGYKYFSSPFSNSTVGNFSSYVDLNPASFPNFYRYDENRQYDADSASTGWKAYTTATDPLEILKGYALNFGSSLTSPKTIEISGKVNNGSLETTLYNNHRLYTKGFNLVGNPYPSPIDWNAAGWTKTNVDDAIYFFTAGSTNQYTGTYTSFVDGVSSDGRSSSIIPSMQGFFVHVTDDTSDPPSKVTATLRVTNPVRTDNSIPQEFLKVGEPEKDPLIRISASFENEVKTDLAVIYFTHFAKLSFEKDKDALKLMNTDITVPNLYSLTPENKKLSINALPKPGSDDVKKIPLGLKMEKDGWMSIDLKDLQNFPSNFNVYLIDSEKRIGQNLSRKPQYRFYAKLGQHDSRFHLMFSESEINDPAIAFDEPFSVKTVDGKVMVSMNLDARESGVLQASTITGQILDRKNVSEKETIEIEGIKSSGVYFFSINLKEGMFSKKVLIQK